MATRPATRTFSQLLAKEEEAARAAGTTRLLVVDTQTCGSFMRANVSLGPPRHAAQLGAAGATQPAASNTCAHSPGKLGVPSCTSKVHALTPSTAFNSGHWKPAAHRSTFM